MDMFNSAQDMFGKGMNAVRGAVSGVAVERQPFMEGFVRLCSDGWLQGWHERNGGNVSYRLTDGEIESCRPFFYEEPGPWINLGIQIGNLGNARFAVTGAGRFMRNVPLDPSYNVGIVQISADGNAWRSVWGFKGGGRPTSELVSHLMCHSVRMAATGGSQRVLYHAHPDNVVALTKILPLDARTVTRVLWKAMTECVMVFPQGVGVAGLMVPGSDELARVTSDLMRTYEAVIWAQHGLFCSGPDFDMTFGLMHTIEKAAGIYGQALMMNGGSNVFANTISDNDLRAIARYYGLAINESFLDPEVY